METPNSQQPQIPATLKETFAERIARIQAARAIPTQQQITITPEEQRIIDNTIAKARAVLAIKTTAPTANPELPVTVLQPHQASMRVLDSFITNDERLLRVKEHVKKLANREECVLIRGDSGTGKELIARALHGNRFGKFVGINCSAISENLLESELFGHVKGAFTGAHADRCGLFAEARSGTLFLDEIGDMSYPLQAKLLRALEERKIRRVGSNTDEEIHCRIICATRIDIEDNDVLDVKFRLDLYYRISTFTLFLLPLAERTFEDFQLFAKAFGGTDEDAEILFANRARLKGNFRSIKQYFKRKQVLGENMF